MSSNTIPTNLGEVARKALSIDDLWTSISEVIIGFIFSLEITYFLFPKLFGNLGILAKTFLTLKVEIPVYLVSFIIFFILGRILVISHIVINEGLIFIYKYLNNEKRKRNKFYSFISLILLKIINFQFASNPLTYENKTLTDPYKTAVISKISEYLELPPEKLGMERYRLAKELSIRHYNHFKLPKIEFDVSFTRGLIMIFLFFSVCELMQRHIILTFLGIFLTIQFMIYLKHLLEQFQIAVCDMAYLEIVLEEKKK